MTGTFSIKQIEDYLSNIVVARDFQAKMLYGSTLKETERFITKHTVNFT